ncbi:hypothetical protein GRF29_185g51929 [Pseudopithomyces chartarum]|uniref:Uncharacterized protein n=1 Tax=Pseudopithomyces chartarum TaxID=1892770 RepID=A0AAN6RC88_9PLEO|nr:hypothetical protein GRF29_185g51929 [Pseudopithomyces chartarum]
MDERMLSAPQGSQYGPEMIDVLQRAIDDFEANVDPISTSQAAASTMMHPFPAHFSQKDEPTLGLTQTADPLSTQSHSSKHILHQQLYDVENGSSAASEQASQYNATLQLENHGLVGFQSIDEVQDYADCSRNGTIQPSVAIVDLHTQDNAQYIADGGPECWLVIHTMTRGKILVTLPANSPFKHEVSGYIAWKARAEAIMELNGENIRQSTFPEIWLKNGGKFDIRNFDDAVHLHPNVFGNGLMKAVNLMSLAPQNQGTATLEAPAFQISDDFNATPMINKNIVICYNDAVDVAPPQVGQDDRNDSESNTVTPAEPDKATPKIHQGLLRRRTAHAPGAIRMWNTNSIMPPRGVAHIHPIFSSAPPAAVDLRMLEDVYITARELMIWFPDHICKWSDCAERLAGAGWSSVVFYKFIYYVRGQLLEGQQPAPAATHRLIRNDLCRFNRFYRWVNPDPNSPPYQDLTCGNWKVPPCGRVTHPADDLMDYYVSDLAYGVSRDKFPTGVDAGPLTAVIQHVLDNANHPHSQMLRLSDVAAFAKHIDVFRSGEQAGVTGPGETHVDVESFARTSLMAFPAVGGGRKSSRNQGNADEDSDMED